MPPSGHLLRKGRYSEPGRLYLVTVVCAKRQRHFVDLRAGRQVVHALRSLSPDAETLCYVIMPDHLHWLLNLRGERSLQAVVQQAKSLATKLIHRSDLSSEQIWQRGFHDRAVRKEDDLKAMARYVVANPLRAGLVKRLGEYPLWDAKWL
ncbi:MAG: transposase [Pseudomonadales bacterium]|nr:transposase [Pseudomonadales bacterium]MCP5358034.1 transposase [Pseudomonadales bacterium]